MKSVAIIGGGPSGLFLFKELIESGRSNLRIEIFEKGLQLGSGMPYSKSGSNVEHITNVSANEIPDLITPVGEWINTVSPAVLQTFHFEKSNFTDFKVLPRLLFGLYLSDQFDLLLKKALENDFIVKIHLDAEIIDVKYDDKKKSSLVSLTNQTSLIFNYIILSTGHTWPKTYEGLVPGYYDSPYPPNKLLRVCNHPVAIKGTSLTAIDAMRTLARANGIFKKESEHKLSYKPENHNFKIVMHSRHGILPNIRSHLADSHLSKNLLLTKEEINRSIEENDGFLSLDFLFEEDFKKVLLKKDPSFYQMIQDMNLEEFVDFILKPLASADPFLQFKEEYEQAEKSIREKRPIHWKEALAILSFAINYPAKHFSAEDMIRLQDVLMPLISIVIAFLPQSSAEELLAMHAAGVLEFIAVDPKSFTQPGVDGIIYYYKDGKDRDCSVQYETYIDCTGQKHLPFESFPFNSLKTTGSVTPARLQFRAKEKAQALVGQRDMKIEKEGDQYFLKVPGIKINDCFQIVDKRGISNPRIYCMAVPFISGYNPDYSGLDFCAEASKIIVKTILNHITST